MIVAREEALKLAPEYVSFAEGNFDLFKVIESKFQRLKRGQPCLTYLNGQFIRCNVTVVSHKDMRALDGPLVRVTDGRRSWRVDGARYAYPLLAEKMA